LLAAAREQGFEGVVAKRLASPYRSGRRNPDWCKVTVDRRASLVVAGYTAGRGGRATTLGALVLGVDEGEGLRWAGNVGTGFTTGTAAALVKLLDPLRQATSPFTETPRMPRVPARDVTWVKPVVVADVSFKEWTGHGRLRAPVFVGVRDDLAADEIGDNPLPMDTVVRRGRRRLELSNLDKPFWPEEGITKGDLLAYYRDVADVLVPHLRGRPFTMKRYPDGWQGKNFFQKDVPKHAPDWLHTAPFPATTREGETRTISYALVDDLLALLWVVNMGCIDLHTWTSQADLPHRPDWVIFDLDPADGVSFEAVAGVALLVREALELLGLEGFPKTSGSKGIHILVPIARRHTHDDARRFASVVAGALARAHPSLVTTQWARSKRHGVLIDANQNGPGRTTAAVYSVRPRAGAPVSAPLRWAEVRSGLDPGSFTMDVVRERIARDGDLAAGVLTQRQSLTAALRAIA
jgi:bifunctional non-homologous end joining protein LigD